MKTLFIDQPLQYDGSQLSSHWTFNNFALLGNSIVAFCGRCDVPVTKMVDLVDVRDNKPIFSENMLHFIVEFFDKSLEETILLQRLLVSLIQQEIIFRTNRSSIVRGGNDLYEEGAKLSVSIATRSPISTLIHYGINISSHNTPVKTKGLDDYKIEVPSFAKAIMESFRDEVSSTGIARAKVKSVL